MSCKTFSARCLDTVDKWHEMPDASDGELLAIAARLGLGPADAQRLLEEFKVQKRRERVAEVRS